MSAFSGSEVRDPNFRLRFCLIVFCGVVAWGAVNMWKGTTLFAAEYQDMPVTHKELEVKKNNEAKKKLFQKNIINIEE